MPKRRIAAIIAVLCVAYALFPYVALYRLGQAVRHGDAATLERLVDWDSVREGIKEDVCDTVFDEPDNKLETQTAELPPFGFSFVRNIAANAVDKTVTPQALVSASRVPQAATSASRVGGEGQATILWAFFRSLARFDVVLQPPGATAGNAPVRVALELRHGAWIVTRAWLPREMLAPGNPRT